MSLNFCLVLLITYNVTYRDTLCFTYLCLYLHLGLIRLYSCDLFFIFITIDHYNLIKTETLDFWTFLSKVQPRVLLIFCFNFCQFQFDVAYEMFLFNFLALLPDFYFWNGDWALGYVYSQFVDFFEISWFGEIQNLRN